MKLSTEIFTAQINHLLALNREVRLKLSSMHSYTELEMLKLEAWLEETQKSVHHLEIVSSTISHHLEILQLVLSEQQVHASTLKH